MQHNIVGGKGRDLDSVTKELKDVRFPLGDSNAIKRLESLAVTILVCDRKLASRMSPESRVRENLLHGSMRGWWKPNGVTIDTVSS